MLLCISHNKVDPIYDITCIKGDVPGGQKIDNITVFWGPNWHGPKTFDTKTIVFTQGGIYYRPLNIFYDYQTLIIDGTKPVLTNKNTFLIACVDKNTQDSPIKCNAIISYGRNIRKSPKAKIHIIFSTSYLKIFTTSSKVWPISRTDRSLTMSFHGQPFDFGMSGNSRLAFNHDDLTLYEYGQPQFTTDCYCTFYIML